MFYRTSQNLGHCLEMWDTKTHTHIPCIEGDLVTLAHTDAGRHCFKLSQTHLSIFFFSWVLDPLPAVSEQEADRLLLCHRPKTTSQITTYFHIILKLTKPVKPTQPNQNMQTADQDFQIRNLQAEITTEMTQESQN